MTDIQRSGDCGNSPKNKLVEDFGVALYTSDTEFLAAHVTEDVRWEIVGVQRLSGREDFVGAVSEVIRARPLRLNVLHAISHGKVGVVNGELVFEDSKVSEFCDVYEFGNTKGTSISAVRSYVIESHR